MTDKQADNCNTLVVYAAKKHLQDAEAADMKRVNKYVVSEERMAWGRE